MVNWKTGITNENLGFPGGAVLKIHLPMQEMQETWFQSLGQEDSLKEEMATHSSILAWKIPRTEDPGGLQSVGLQRVEDDCVSAHTHNRIYYI